MEDNYHNTFNNKNDDKRNIFGIIKNTAKKIYSSSSSNNIVKYIINEVNSGIDNDFNYDNMLLNSGKSKVSGFKINMIGTKDVTINEISKTLDVGDVSRFFVSYKRNIGSLQQIKIFPKELNSYCTNYELDIEDIRECD